jgi:hypothetical protein
VLLLMRLFVELAKKYLHGIADFEKLGMKIVGHRPNNSDIADFIGSLERLVGLFTSLECYIVDSCLNDMFHGALILSGEVRAFVGHIQNLFDFSRAKSDGIIFFI